mgnify:FL=1
MLKMNFVKLYNYEVEVQFQEIFEDVETAANQKSPGKNARCNLLSANFKGASVKTNGANDNRSKEVKTVGGAIK